MLARACLGSRTLTRRSLLSASCPRLARAAHKPSLPQLDEDDLEETWVRGSGPGGQSINKTNISCSLIHRPTGIRVQCHETRSREWNRSLARKIMREKLDLHLNPGKSSVEAKWDKLGAKKAAAARKRRRKADAKINAKTDAEAASTSM